MRLMLDLEVGLDPIGKKVRPAENMTETGKNFALYTLLPRLDIQRHNLAFCPEYIIYAAFLPSRLVSSPER